MFRIDMTILSDVKVEAVPGKQNHNTVTPNFFALE